MKLIVVLCLVLTLVGCRTPYQSYQPYSNDKTIEPAKTEEVDKPPFTIKISKSLIDAAIVRVNDSPDWAMGILDVDVNFLTGVAVEGAMVIHNGTDTDYLTRLNYVPVLQQKIFNNRIYQPTPYMFGQYVTFDKKPLRLLSKENKVVSITIYIPKELTTVTDSFTFGVAATGLPISQETVILENITTEETATLTDGTIVPDDFVEIILATSLLLDELTSVKSITSSLGESIYTVNYEPSNRVLRVEGLRPSSTRTITLTYEYTGMFAIAYTQHWYITMMKEGVTQ